MIRQVLLAALLLAGCATSPGHHLADRGIGGTGGAARIADRGIGGTGVETGIVGTITGFGSIIVNGIEVASDTLPDVEIDGVRRPVTALQIGQVAQVLATSDASGVRARTVEVTHEVSGPVQRLLPNGAFLIAGQRVRVTRLTRGAPLQVGEWVDVSGLRNALGAIIASRLDRRPAGDVTITGRLVPWRGRWRIGLVEVDLPPGFDARPRRVRVTGELANNVLSARTAVPAPQIRFRPGLRRLIVQAFVRANLGRLRLGDGPEATAAGEFGRVSSDAPVVLDLTTDDNGALVATGVRAPNDGSGSSGGTSGGGASATSSSAASAHGAETSGGGHGGGATGKK